MGRALVIDDELDICLMMNLHLQNLHFETQYARTVKDARLKVDISPFELMVIDLNLTDGSGLEVIGYVRDLNLTSKIIVISAHDSESNKALLMGASLFISKPFTIRTINEALKKLNFLPG
jgi:DNA-binding response OmpR family regulator